jgi:hypothetical protein
MMLFALSTAFLTTAVVLERPVEIRGTPQEPTAPGPTAGWKADFKLALEQKDGAWVFVIEGRTNVPPEVVLKARVYAVEVVDDFQRGKREDEEPLVWEDDELQPGVKTVEREGGRFREEVYRFARRPYTIFYRARLHYRPRDNQEEVQRKFGEDEWSAHADLRPAKEQEREYEEELRTRVQEVTEDLVAIDALLKEIRARFDAHLKVHDRGAWKAWKEGWYSRVEKLNERNKTRFGLWAVWMERQAKMRLGGMCELLRRLLVQCTDRLEDPAKKLEPILELIEAFGGYYEEAVEVIGIPLPLDPAKIGPALAVYENAYRAFRASMDQPAAEAVALRGAARRDAFQALLQIPPMLRNRKSAYRLVNDLGARFRKLLDLAEGKPSPEALRQALEEHDAALRDFKKLAGLP